MISISGGNFIPRERPSSYPITRTDCWFLSFLILSPLNSRDEHEFAWKNGEGEGERDDKALMSHLPDVADRRWNRTRRQSGAAGAVIHVHGTNYLANTDSRWIANCTRYNARTEWARGCVLARNVSFLLRNVTSRSSKNKRRDLLHQQTGVWFTRDVSRGSQMRILTYVLTRSTI